MRRQIERESLIKHENLFMESNFCELKCQVRYVCMNLCVISRVNGSLSFHIIDKNLCTLLENVQLNISH